MQDGDAQLAVLVDVGVEQGTEEAEGGGRVRVVVREAHFGEEVASMVEGGRVEDDQSNGPLEDVVVNQLGGVLAGVPRSTVTNIITSILHQGSLWSSLNSFMSIFSAAEDMMMVMMTVVSEERGKFEWERRVFA